MDIVLPLLIEVREIYFLAFVCYVCSYLCGDCVLGAGLFAENHLIVNCVFLHLFVMFVYASVVDCVLGAGRAQLQFFLPVCIGIRSQRGEAVQK